MVCLGDETDQGILLGWFLAVGTVSCYLHLSPFPCGDRCSGRTTARLVFLDIFMRFPVSWVVLSLWSSRFVCDLPPYPASLHSLQITILLKYWWRFNWKNFHIGCIVVRFHLGVEILRPLSISVTFPRDLLQSLARTGSTPQVLVIRSHLVLGGRLWSLLFMFGV